MDRKIKHFSRESLDVRDEESCYFPQFSPNVTTIPPPSGTGRILEPEFRDSIEFLGFGEGDDVNEEQKREGETIFQHFLSLCSPMLVPPVSPLTKLI